MGKSRVPTLTSNPPQTLGCPILRVVWPCLPASNGVPASFARGVFNRYQQSKHFHFITFSQQASHP